MHIIALFICWREAQHLQQTSHWLQPVIRGRVLTPRMRSHRSPRAQTPGRPEAALIVHSAWLGSNITHFLIWQCLCMLDIFNAKKKVYSPIYVPSTCNTHLTQQEELVSAFLSVLVIGALHLLQVNSIQLELLVDKNRTLIRFFFSFSPHTHAFFGLCVSERYNEMGTSR